MIGQIIYRFFVLVYPLMVQLVSRFNPKAAQWIAGRKDIFTFLEQTFASETASIVWVHCASLGEFEQGRPIIESLKKQRPATKILLSFFSPSGYTVANKYPFADWVIYLPMDSPSHAKRFFEIVHPSLILFVKYEFWYYYLSEAKQQGIPLLLVSGIFRADQPFFQWYGGFHRKMLACFTWLFVQNKSAEGLLHQIGLKDNVRISGDTRFDRVLEIAEHFKDIPLVSSFLKSSKKVVVAGSTWTEDDEELDHYANTHLDVRFIIAPHDISAERIEECLKLYQHSVTYSALNQNNTMDVSDKNVLIIDNIGMLSRLYRYATVCLVGGGFAGDGVHNVLEAAVYAKPVLFGPIIDKYAEAKDLVELGGAFVVENALEMEKKLDSLLLKDETYEKASHISGNYVHQQAGASRMITEYIFRHFN